MMVFCKRFISVSSVNAVLIYMCAQKRRAVCKQPTVKPKHVAYRVKLLNHMQTPNRYVYKKLAGFYIEDFDKNSVNNVCLIIRKHYK